MRAIIPLSIMVLLNINNVHCFKPKKEVSVVVTQVDSREGDCVGKELTQWNKLPLEKAAAWPRPQPMEEKPQPPGKQAGSESERVTDFPG